MEGWLYGLFALIGVLFGGIFTYLGMKKQLEQQSELDSCQWRRKVRGQPLLALRAELANMATKRDRLLAARDRAQASARKQHIDMTEEAARELQEAENDWDAYRVSGKFSQILFLHDAELINKVEEIQRATWATWASILDAGKKVRERNKARVIEVQELINKRLEEL